ncbi:MAG: energy-coupling factor transporter transmembrane component T [Candidatus Bathyarchaeia archaeon]
MKIYGGLKFKRVSSPLHNLDPRVKFLLAATIFLGAMIFDRLLPLTIIFMSTVPVVIVGKLLREWVRVLRSITVFSAVIFTAHLLSNLSIHGYIITSETLETSAVMALKFIIIVGSFSIFLTSTSPDDFSVALQKIRIPFELCFAFTMAVRFVPLLAMETQFILDAQRARGLELDRGRFISRVKNYVPVLFPLVANSIRRSWELAEVMEARGYGLSRRRTSLYELKFKNMDYLVSGLAIFAMVTLTYVKFTVPMLTSQ